ncbi:MAG: class I SAM-dependent methyltransferase [Thermoleophilia bacterium]|nr:class I SAM-dependent methyltransferase [Thermoleophilia bacterium]
MNASDDNIPAAYSITHQHIAAVINTYLSRQEPRDEKQEVRILDMGCGNGRMMGHFSDVLPALQYRYSFDVNGLDVVDAGQQVEGFMDETIGFLSARHPRTDWRKKLTLTTADEGWPYPDGSFDFITSNSVMEHVMDYDFVFREVARCLRPGGVCVHLFPTREVLWEGHALMPIVHKIRDVDKRARYMRLFARMGFTGHYKREMDRRDWKSVDEFARIFSRVLETDTNYITEKKLTSVARAAELNISYRYTKDLFLAKAQSFVGKRSYTYRDLGVLERVALIFCKRISSITVSLEKSA